MTRTDDSDACGHGSILEQTVRHRPLPFRDEMTRTDGGLTTPHLSNLAWTMRAIQDK